MKARLSTLILAISLILSVSIVGCTTQQEPDEASIRGVHGDPPGADR